MPPHSEPHGAWTDFLIWIMQLGWLGQSVGSTRPGDLNGNHALNVCLGTLGKCYHTKNKIMHTALKFYRFKTTSAKFRQTRLYALAWSSGYTCCLLRRRQGRNFGMLCLGGKHNVWLMVKVFCHVFIYVYIYISFMVVIKKVLTKTKENKSIAEQVLHFVLSGPIFEWIIRDQKTVLFIQIQTTKEIIR